MAVGVAGELVGECLGPFPKVQQESLEANVDSMRIATGPGRLMSQRTGLRHHLAGGKERRRVQLPRESASLAVGVVDPDGVGDAQVGHGIAEALEQDSDDLRVVIGLSHEFGREGCNVWMAETLRGLSKREARHVLEERTASREGGKIGVCRLRRPRQRGPGKADPNVLGSCPVRS